MESIQEYFDDISEIETDEILDLIRENTGGTFGSFCAYSWDLRRPKRFKTLLKTVGAALIFGIPLTIHSITAYKCMNYDMAFTVETLAVGNFFLFPFIFLFLNIFKHRSVCTIFKLIHDGFVQYGEFPNNEEIKIREKLAKDLKLLSKFWFYCCASAGPVGFIVMYIDNRNRDPNLLPDSINKEMAIPLWTYFEVKNPILVGLLSAIQLIMMVALMSSLYGILTSVSRSSLTYINECEVIAKALRHQEERAVKTYVRFMRSRNRPVNLKKLDVVKLYKNKHFSLIYQHCYKKIIYHHQLLVRHLECANELHGFAVLVIEYTYGGLLALCLCTSLDKTLAWSIRIFLFAVFGLVLIFVSFFCFCGQTAADVMKDLHEEVYMSQWIDADEDCKKLVKIFHNLTLNPGDCKSSLGTVINYNSLVVVLQACYSIVNFIQLRQTEL